MTSRERVISAINHRKPDRVPVDLDATNLTGINSSSLYRLREYLGLSKHPIVVKDIFQMLGVVDKDVLDIIKPDVVGLNGRYNFIGVKDTGEYSDFNMFDGTPTKQFKNNVFKKDENGNIFTYPEGDDSVEACAYMPPTGYYFDNIDRVPDYIESELNPKEDFANLYKIISEEDALYYQKEAKRLYEETDLAVIGNLGVAGLGDVAHLPGPTVKHPKGIRRMDEWLMAHILYPDYVEEVYELQTEAALKNLEIFRQAVGENIQVVFVSGTDFGTQIGSFISPNLFKKMYKPRFQRVNDWIHNNTNWKTFYHSCGSLIDYLDDFVDMGVDIINPVQLSAKGMNPTFLKEKYGDKLVFWGGGVDTQYMLPFGNPEEIEVEVEKRLEILSTDGGYIFSTIHNIVGNIPPENIMAMYKAVHKFNGMNI